MFQSHVYLEVRILVSTEKQMVFKGKKPELSSGAIQKAVALARSLNVNFSTMSTFEKLTDFPPVPENCSFTGLSVRLGEKGFMEIEFHHRKKTITIDEIRIEEDAGRLTRSSGVPHMDYTWVGCPSLRIKTAPDFELGEEAELFLNELRRRLQYMQLLDGVSADSIIRCNAYVALSRYPDLPDYYVKLRNLNSFNFVRKAINSEIDRQEQILSSGGEIESESRLWNEKQNLTEFYQPRSKDLRQFESLKPAVEFDFSPFLSAERDGKFSIEQPEDRRKRLCREYGLARERAELICDEKARADFFENAVKAGAEPMTAAHWISSELIKLLRRKGTGIEHTLLTPEYFSVIMNLLSSGEIHSGIAKQLMQAVVETGEAPVSLIQRNNWQKITDADVLSPIVKEVVKNNPQESEKLRKGEMAPLEFLTGLVMKKTNGLAAPQIVKQLLKEELNISIVYVLSMGGAICANRQKNGEVAAGDTQVLRSLLADTDKSVHYQVISVGKLLSEEIEPADWAELIAEVAARIATGTANGIVIAHGTDTLAYTAPLLVWLFSDCDVPVVITASSVVPDASDEAKRNLQFAVKTACNKKNGVYVVYGGKLLSPLNLKFEKPAPDGFTNWNMDKPVYTCDSGPFAKQGNILMDADTFVLKQVLKEAANNMVVCKVYPGLRSESYLRLVDEGIRYIFLELYETGTASMRSSDYSLKPLLLKGRKKGCKFFCTSQQQSLLDFSDYSTSRRMWREGAVPMGGLTTESAIALYFAASIVADSSDELDSCMESYSRLF